MEFAQFNFQQSQSTSSPFLYPSIGHCCSLKLEIWIIFERYDSKYQHSNKMIKTHWKEQHTFFEYHSNEIMRAQKRMASFFTEKPKKQVKITTYRIPSATNTTEDEVICLSTPRLSKKWVKRLGGEPGNFIINFVNISILKNVTWPGYQVKQKGDYLCMELENCKSIYKSYGEKLPDSTARNVCKAAPPKKQTKVYLEVSNEVSVFKETTIE